MMQANLFDDPSAGHPLVLVADPPWLFENNQVSYPCMSVREICLVPIPRVGRNAVLFLWRVAAMQAEALEVARAWDFDIRSELIWLKTTKNGKRAFGAGYYTRMEHEVCLIGVRGVAPPAVHNVRSTFSAPLGVHSAKPKAFYDIVRRMYPNSRRYELFARTVRRGFLQFGNELGKLGEEEDAA